MAEVTTARYSRLRSASRVAASFGIAAWVLYLILATAGQDRAFLVALTELLVYVGTVLVLGSMMFAVAASLVSDEKPVYAAAAEPVVDLGWVPRSRQRQADAARPLDSPE